MFLLSTFCFVANADEPRRHSLVGFVHGGYGYLPSDIPGLTDISGSYKNIFNDGGTWDAQLFYKYRILMLGLHYSGFTAGSELTNSSDRIFTHYIAPQAGMLFPVYRQFSLSFNGGLGCLWYLNNSVLYEKDRKVTGSAFALNLAARGIYNVTERIGISLQFMALGGSLQKTKVHYHDEDITVKMKGPTFNFNRLAVSLGLKFSF
jgi:hypothetical protein